MIRALFFGTPDFAAHILEDILTAGIVQVVCVITNPDRPAGRGKKHQQSPVKSCALRHGIPLLQPESIKKSLPEFLQSLTSYHPVDIGIVVAFGQILPQEVLDFPRAGCVNIHASLLPRWRGAAPIQRALIAGDRETGVCLMKMEAGLDTGPVYSHQTLALRTVDVHLPSHIPTSGELHDALARIGASLLRRDITAIAHGALVPNDQPIEGITYASKISNAEAKIDWTQSAEVIRNLILGLSPHPGAYTTCGGKRVKIFYATVVPSSESVNQHPGSITRCRGSEIRVACGRGEISLADLQFEGGKRMSAADCIHGQLLHESLVFGD